MGEAVNSQPLVSVLMPVYNAEKHLKEAMNSILLQTYQHLEVVIVNDGSTDGSEALLLSYDDPRIRLLVNSENKGLIYSLNYGLSACKGKYVARMDADDICMQERIAEQVAFMEQHPEIGVCGCDYTQFSESGEQSFRALSDHDEILSQMIFNSSVVHPSLMLRRSVLQDFDPVFNPGYHHSEDYELWSKLILQTQFSAVHRLLFRYRIHAAQVTQKHSEQQQLSASRVRKELLGKLGFSYTEQEVDLLSQMAAHRLFDKKEQLDLLEQFLEKLIAQNDQSKRIAPEIFKKVLSYKWYTACGYTTLGLWTFGKYRRSELKSYNPQSSLKLLAKCLVRRFRKRA